MIKDFDANYESIQDKFLQNMIKIEEDDADIFADESVLMSEDLAETGPTSSLN